MEPEQTPRVDVFDTRLGAYAVIVKDGEVLLARWTGGGFPRWTLPGGGVDFGESIEDGALREITEETGYTAVLDGLLGVGSHHIAAEKRLSGSALPLKGVQIIYEAHVSGGALRDETAGSTDRAAWIPLAAVTGLERVPMVDFALELYHQKHS